MPCSYVPGENRRPPLGVRFRNLRNGGSWRVVADDGVHLTMRDEDSEDQMAIGFSALTFDAKWEAIENAFAPDDYLYRFFLHTGDEEPVDSGQSLAELPRVGMKVTLPKKGDNSPWYVVDSVVDGTFNPTSGGQARADMWVSAATS